ncbi:MAG: hypothetical protein ACE5HI_09790 [bacterium]
MRSTITVLLLVTLLVLGLGCEREREQPASTPSSAQPPVKSQRVSSRPFVPTPDAIQGQWFVVATNPAFAGKIITDYISYEFGLDGSVAKTTRSSGKVQIEKGTYSWNPEAKVVEVKINLGQAGIQLWTWRQEALGKARIVYWKNLTHGHEHSEDDLYVKKGTDEWNRRGKKALSPETSNRFIDPFDLESGVRYRLSKETPLMPEFDPQDPMRALQTAKKIPTGGVVTILSRKQKAASPWYHVRYGTHQGWINSVALVGQTLERLR